MLKGLRLEMVWFQLRVSDHGDIQKMWSPSRDFSNDVSYKGLSETFKNSTCMKLS